ncbi:MAG: hypothetical protein ACHQO8_11330 [Vicinamibacterales bacterium]
MTDVPRADGAATALDVGAYCRQVEDYLTRVNGGHLVRIVGPGFELVRGWAEEGIPLSVVRRGIDFKAERQRAGQAKRPLRIEFCEADVRSLYDNWRRAVGLSARRDEVEDETRPDAADEDRRRPSLSKHLDRVVERLSRAAGRLDVPESVRETVAALLADTTALRDAAKKARGEARAAIADQLAPLDARLLGDARAAASPELRASLEQAASRELAAYRDRLPAGRWDEAVSATVDRLLRDLWSLPTIDV